MREMFQTAVAISVLLVLAGCGTAKQAREAREVTSQMAERMYTSPHVDVMNTSYALGHFYRVQKRCPLDIGELKGWVASEKLAYDLSKVTGWTSEELRGTVLRHRVLVAGQDLMTAVDLTEFTAIGWVRDYERLSGLRRAWQKVNAPQ